MKRQEYSPKEALERVKLMMNYDSRKTLTENMEFINEQLTLSDAAKIAKELTDELIGDVDSDNLMSVKDILTNSVFGKSLQDGSCFLNKVDEYFKSTKAGIWNLGFLNPKDYTKRDLLTILKDSGEYDEPQFDDIKNEIIKLITDERSNFCTKKQEPTCPSGQTLNPKTNKCETPTCPAGQTLNPKTNKCSGGGSSSTGSFKAVCADPYSIWCKEKDPNGPLHKVQRCLDVEDDGLFGERTEGALFAKTKSKTFMAKDVDRICTSSGGGGSQQPTQDPEYTIDTQNSEAGETEDEGV